MSLQDYINALQDRKIGGVINRVKGFIGDITRGQEITPLMKLLKRLDDEDVREEVYDEFSSLMRRVGEVSGYYGDDVINAGYYSSRDATLVKIAPSVTDRFIKADVDPFQNMDVYQTFAKEIGYEAPEQIEDAKAVEVAGNYDARVESLPEVYSGYLRQGIERGIVAGWSVKALESYASNVVTGLPISGVSTLMTTLGLEIYRIGCAFLERLNGSFLGEKIRVATLDGATCAACIALHGTHVEIGESISDHYNGRCDTRYVFGKTEIQSGEDWFAELDDEQQLAMLGPGKYAKYKEGVRLSDMVDYYHDDVFGEMPIVKALKNMD